MWNFLGLFLAIVILQNSIFIGVCLKLLYFVVITLMVQPTTAIKCRMHLGSKSNTTKATDNWASTGTLR